MTGFVVRRRRGCSCPLLSSQAGCSWRLLLVAAASEILLLVKLLLVELLLEARPRQAASELEIRAGGQCGFTGAPGAGRGGIERYRRQSGFGQPISDRATRCRLAVGLAAIIRQRSLSKSGKAKGAVVVTYSNTFRNTASLESSPSRSSALGNNRPIIKRCSGASRWENLRLAL